MNPSIVERNLKFKDRPAIKVFLTQRNGTPRFNVFVTQKEIEYINSIREKGYPYWSDIRVRDKEREGTPDCDFLIDKLKMVNESDVPN